MVQVLPSSYFRANFLTVRPNAANDMALERMNKCETFFVYIVSPNSLQFHVDFEND